MSIAYAACGHDVWVGNAEMCDARCTQFDLTIHVHHSQSPTPGRCKTWDVPADSPRDIFVRYIDGSSLGSMLSHNGQIPLTIPDVARFARREGRLLAHCAAGLCRGPTMAVLAKVARGCTPWQAMHDVAQGMWLGYQQAPQFFNLPITEICRWYWDGKR